MKTDYEYTKFVMPEEEPKIRIWECFSRQTSAELGHVKWWSKWQEYCFFPVEDLIINQHYLEDITCFLKEIRQQHFEPLHVQCEKYERALKFYANKDNYVSQKIPGTKTEEYYLVRDNGECARVALEKKRKEQK